MDPKSSLLFGFSAIQLIICAGLFSVAHNNRRAKWLAISIIPTFLWSVFIGLFLNSSDANCAKLFSTIYYIAAAIIPPCYMFLAFVFTERKISHFVAISVPAMTAIISIMVAIPNSFITGVDIHSHSVSTSFIHHIIYATYFSFFYITSLALILIAYFRKSKKNINPGIFVSGWLILGTVGIVFNLLLPLLGNYDLIWVGPVGLVMLVPMAFRIATTDQHFSAIKTFARGLLYCVFGVLCIACAFISLYFFENIIRSFGSTELEIYSLGIIVIFFLVALLFLVHYLIKNLTKALDTAGINEINLLGDISRITATQHDPKDFFRSVRQTLSKACEVRQVDIMIFGENTVTYADNTIEDTIMRLTGNNKHHAVYHGDIRSRKDLNLLITNDIELIVPIVAVIENRTIGAILLSPRKRKFDRYYGRVLEHISAVLTPFIQSSIYHKEILNINSRMKTEIAKKTQKLRTSNQELVKLDVMKSDLLTISSHNLRTPITGISGYAEMLLMDSAGPLNVTQRSYVSAIMRSATTMRQIISSLLDVSHIDSGDFTLHSEPFNLSELVQEEISPLKEIASKKGRTLTLTLDRTADIQLTADIARIKQVIINFVDNAIYYGKTRVDVTLEQTNHQIIFKVVDDGIGIPKDEQCKIFDKMYRASNAQIQRPDGTGVGLYVAKNVITASGGKLIFDSTLGKGSTFGFKINQKGDINELKA